jgi:PAS domain S-box-containing protein
MRLIRENISFSLAVVMAAGILVLDLIAPLGACVWVLYVLPLLIDQRRSRMAYLIAAISSLFMLVALIPAVAQGLFWKDDLFNRITGAGVVWIIVVVLVERNHIRENLKRQREGLEREIEERTTDLAASEERYRALFENSHDAIFLTDPIEGKVLTANPAALELYGMPESDLPLPRYETMDTGNPRFAIFLSRREKKGKVTIETTHRKRDGTLFWGEVSSALYQDRKGRTRAVNVIRDTTERRRTQAALLKAYDELEARVEERTRELLDANRALQASESLYRTIFQTTNAATMIIEDDMTITIVNDEFERLLKYSRAETEGRMSILRLLSPEEAETIANYHRRRRLEPDAVPRSYPVRLTRGDGEIRDMCVTAGVIPGTKKSVASVTDVTEQNVAERLLRESEERYRIAIEHSNDGVALVGGNRHLFVNRKFLEMFGYDRPDEVVEKDVSLIVHPRDAQRVREINRDRQHGEHVPAHYDFEAVTKDGRTMHIEVSAARIFYQGQSVSLAYLRDVTERKKAEEARRKIEAELRQSEKRFRDMADLLPEAVFETDARGFLTYVNQQAFAAFRAPKENVFTGINVLSRIAPEDRQRAREDIQRVLSGAGRVSSEYSAIRNDGNRFPVLVHASPVANGDTVVGIRGVIVDMSERHRVEQQITRLAKAVEGLAEGVSVLSFDGTIEYANPATCLLVGRQQADLTGQNIRHLDLFETERLETIWGMLKDGRSWTGKASFPANEGSVTVELAISPVKDRRGRITSYILTQRDITDKLRLETQLRQAQKMEAIGTLAGGIAHDFNNILAVIIGNTELALDDAQPGSPVVESLERVMKASGRGRDLVKQILTFSRRSEAGKAPVAMTPLIKETLQLLRSSLPASIAIVPNLVAVDDIVNADAVQLQQVVMNLATNAAFAMRSDGGTLSVGLEETYLSDTDLLPEADMQPGRYLKLTVRDTGTGMTDDIRKRIFDPFFTTKEAGQGTGMGLAVVYGIVESHHGSIMAASEPGKGSLFTLLLPVHAERPTGAGHAQEEDTSPRGSARILFVEDEEAVAESVSTMLARLGYIVTCRQKPIEALREFTQDPDRFDVVITDQTMPEMSGTHLAQAVLKMRPSTPVILCTGYSESVSAQQAEALGIASFVMKPITRREMAATIQHVLQEKTVSTA